MRTSVLTPVLAVALVVGTACKGPSDNLDTNLDHFAYVARGANVIPMAVDTAARTTGTVLGSNLTFTFHVVKLPTGATQIDSIFLYTIGASAANYSVGNTGATTYVAPSARLCGSSGGTTGTGVIPTGTSVPACAADVSLTGQPTAVTATNGTVTTNTAATLTSSMRGYNQQMVFFTSGSFYKRGTVRGTPYVAP